VYIGHFLSFRVILVIFWVFNGRFFRFSEYINHFLDFWEIMDILGVYWSF
jgi:hypothetical protein